MILELHHKVSLKKLHGGAPEGVTGLDETQVKIMSSALSLGDLKINDIYTPISKVLPIYLDTEFSLKTVKMIKDTGYSRVPVAYSK